VPGGTYLIPVVSGAHSDSAKVCTTHTSDIVFYFSLCISGILLLYDIKNQTLSILNLPD